jgi:hypothetical protein
MLLAYFCGIVALVATSFLPSEVETIYSWQGVLVYGALLVGLGLGSNFCRMVLLVVGIVWAVGVASVSSSPPDAVAVVWCVLSLCVSLLLLSPSIRGYTRPDKTLGE